MARLVAVAFGQASMPLHQIQALRVCRHTLAVALKLDFFIWELVHVQGVTAIADLIAAKEQFALSMGSARRHSRRCERICASAIVAPSWTLPPSGSSGTLRR